jgi:hypothetical protein
MKTAMEMRIAERYEFERRAKLHEIAIKGVITPGWCKIAEYECNRSEAFRLDITLDCDSLPKRHQDRVSPSGYRNRYEYRVSPSGYCIGR